MADILLEFDKAVSAHDKTMYFARACADRAGDGTRNWHGWIEFIPVLGGAAIRTPRETTQPDRNSASRWATGLSRIYLEGALERALRAGVTVAVRHPERPAR